MYYQAEKEGIAFLAYSPPELLGLVVLWERFGESWNCQEPNVLGAILEAMPDA